MDLCKILALSWGCKVKPGTKQGWKGWENMDSIPKHSPCSWNRIRDVTGARDWGSRDTSGRAKVHGSAWGHRLTGAKQKIKHRGVGQAPGVLLGASSLGYGSSGRLGAFPQVNFGPFHRWNSPRQASLNQNVNFLNLKLRFIDTESKLRDDFFT